MFSILLAIIYISFISLGLPDSLLGSAWPVMRTELDVPLSYAGILTMIIAGCTIIASLCSDKMTKKWGTGMITAVSVGMTALALLGFSVSGSYWMLCVFAVPYGLGAGGVDAALNNYVALHYSSRHMSWLHAFWGVGVSVSPYIMSFCLAHGNNWENGYFSVFAIQIILTVILFASLPLWKKCTAEKSEISQSFSLKDVFKIKGASYCLIAFLCFCAFETTAGLWASSYLADFKNVDVKTAARFASLFYLGITAGRFLSGFVADRVGDRGMIRAGTVIMLAGAVMVMLPLKTDAFALSGLVIMGFGSAPVYPCFIHSTPVNFGKENSQALVGVQMASAYTGSTLMPPLFGVLAEKLSLGLYPFYLAAFIILVIVLTEVMNKRLSE